MTTIRPSSLASENGRIIVGDCLDHLKGMDENSVDAIVTDPPYGISFMGKRWDYDVPGEDVWRECLRVLKPGGHAMVACGTRTQHRMACRIEDAGFELRDIIAWLYGSGFPKSHDVSKAIDKAAGAKREVLHERANRSSFDENGEGGGGFQRGTIQLTAPATEAARQWDGWGTALKPAMELWTLCRKPLSEPTVAANVLKWGTGALNIDGCRVQTGDNLNGGAYARSSRKNPGDATSYATGSSAGEFVQPAGRWPANLIHDGSQMVLELFPAPHGAGKARLPDEGSHSGPSGMFGLGEPAMRYGDSGSAARFFKECPPDETCPLCCLPYAEACDTIQVWKNTLASIAEKRGWTSQATSEFIARTVAIGIQSESLVLNVKSAGSLCDLCATSIAVALVGIKTSAFSSAELQAILACTTNCNASILIRNLASFAELWASTDTIPTTTSLSILFGSVRDAIANYTPAASGEAAGQKSAPARFAYIPKASKRERDAGLAAMPIVTADPYGQHRGRRMEANDARFDGKPAKQGRNYHPTVKPVALMEYLCRLITPPEGLVLDPFAGSGSTGVAASREGFRFIGIEREAEYAEIAEARIAAARGGA